MKIADNKLMIRRFDNKIKDLHNVVNPSEGWIRTARTTLNMSLRQLGERMSITPQSVRDLEMREQVGAITLKALKEAANALDMQLVYGLIPNDATIEKMIERKAYELATKIVTRASITMKLENQENSKERISDAINDLADELKKELPKKLWD